MARTQTRRPARRGPARPDHQLPPGRGDDPEPGPGRPGLGTLLRSLAEDMGTLVRQEIQLAKAEAGHTVKRVAADGAWIAAGTVIAAVGALCLVLALALGLGALLDSYWLGTLITGAVLVLGGALVAWKGVRDLRKGELAPTRIVKTLRDDAEWAKREVRDFKEELTKER
ncbi:MAG TPA: phage holin family protein [Longimicrobiales bacterium]|nr:phage holin family protein [Longimicrobiales bacterium]